MLSALFNDLYLGLIVTLVLAVMLTGSVHLMMVSALVWVAVFSGTGDVCGSVCFREDPEKVIFIITGTEVLNFSY